MTPAHIMYWFRSDVGPRKAVLVTDHSNIRIDFTNRDHYQKVLKADDHLLGIVLLYPDNKWSFEYRGIEPDSIVYGNGGYKTQKLAIEALKRQRTRFVRREMAVRNDPVKFLDRKLKHHDWYYDMSDDNRVFRAGEAHSNLIREMMLRVPLTTARKLYKQHAPNTFRFPAEALKRLKSKQN